MKLQEGFFKKSTNPILFVSRGVTFNRLNQFTDLYSYDIAISVCLRQVVN